MTDDTWRPDLLGSGFDSQTLDLGADPDGEPDVVATVVRGPVPTGPSGPAVLYVHGFTDYFFQRHVAAHLAARGSRLYALDLRKCGRSRRPGQTPHLVTDLEFYDDELERALAIVRADQEAAGADARVVVMGHSTGGLILPLWLDRRRRRGRDPRADGIVGQVLNSPWLDLQGPAVLRSAPVTAAVRALGRLAPTAAIPAGVSTAYGDTVHRDFHGEWDYDLDWKPRSGFSVRAGWLAAVRRGHAAIHRGIDAGVPTLVLRSDRSSAPLRYTEIATRSDVVLDVRQIARWSAGLAAEVTAIAVPGALHDVFLSRRDVRDRALAELDRWLDCAVGAAAGRQDAPVDEGEARR